jgi:acetyl esterase/lipase
MPDTFTVDGVTRYRYGVSPAGVVLTPADGGPPRLLGWRELLSLPRAWGVVASGELVREFDTARDAHDAADDLRAAGIPSQVVAIPYR